MQTVEHFFTQEAVMSDSIHSPSTHNVNDYSQQEDAALKTAWQFFASDLLPFFQISGSVKGIAPTELISLELKKLFQDFNLIMEDGSWKHFEFQSKNEGLAGLKRFRTYEALTSYQHKVPITTYVLFSGNIKNPMTSFSEGINTYKVAPIIMKRYSADRLIRRLQRKLKAKKELTKTDLVPLTLCLLMGGKMSLKDRVTESFHIIHSASHIPNEDRSHMEAVLYLMADKFLEPAELNKLKEEIHMTQLGQMLVDWGIEQGLEQGIQKGAKQKTQEFIINALKLGLSDEDILRLTECTSDELQAAREHWLSR